MARSIISVTQGSGTKLATSNYTDGADSKHDEVVVLGEQFLPTYSTRANGVAVGTLNDHLLQIMAGASLKVRIRRIRIEQQLAAGTAATAIFGVLRLTTAGTGGTAVTPNPYNPADAASGATSMTLPTAQGTVGVELMRINVGMLAAQPLTTTNEWVQLPGQQPIVIASGTSNGIVIRNLVAIATAQVNILVEFDEAPY